MDFSSHTPAPCEPFLFAASPSSAWLMRRIRIRGGNAIKLHALSNGGHGDVHPCQQRLRHSRCDKQVVGRSASARLIIQRPRTIGRPRQPGFASRSKIAAPLGRVTVSGKGRPRISLHPSSPDPSRHPRKSRCSPNIKNEFERDLSCPYQSARRRQWRPPANDRTAPDK